METLGELGEDLKVWTQVSKRYWEKKFKIAFSHFETAKSYLVDFLMARRGLRQRPFLHFGMFLLLGAGLVGAPLLATNYPTLGRLQPPPDPPSAVLNTQTASEVETVTEESVKPRDKVISYKVQKGDTLSSIGEKFGVSVDTLRWANDLKSIKDIAIGQELKILPVSGVAHKVQKSETIYTIAKKYEANPQAIVDFPFNDFLDPSTFTLALGTTLIVPDGTKPEEKPWAPPKRPLPTIPQTLAGGRLNWPTSGQLSQSYVWYHKGVDIANKGAPAILAAEGGRVVSVIRQNFAYGWHVIVDHGGGLQTLYAHLSGIEVKEGDLIKKGEVLGQMGCTGRCTGTHLHFEVRQNGIAQPPLNFLK